MVLIWILIKQMWSYDLQASTVTQKRLVGRVNTVMLIAVAQV